MDACRPAWKRTLPVLSGVLLLLAQPVTALADAPPANDDRADATVVTAVPFSDVVDVSNATTEDGEPNPSCLTYADDEFDEAWTVPIGHTVWYAVTLRNRTQVLVDTAGSGYDTVAAVYTTDLAEVTCNDDAGSLQARVGFTAERGQTYLVQIGSYGAHIDPEWQDPTLVLSIARGREVTRQPHTERYSYAGLIAGADTAWGASGYVGVWMEQGRATYPWSRGPERLDRLSLYAYDEVVDDDKGTVTFTDWWGEASPSGGTIDRRLSSASVDQVVEVVGYSCTGPYIDWDEIDENGLENGEWEFHCLEPVYDTVHAQVDWTGVGPTSRSNERGRYQDEWGSYSYRFRGTFRDAEVAGRLDGEVLSVELDEAWGWLANMSYSEQYRVARR